MFTITRRFHSNLLNQTLRPFLVFELGRNLNNLMSLTRNISNEGKKLEKDPFSTLDSASEIYNSLALMGSVSTKSLNL